MKLNNISFKILLTITTLAFAFSCKKPLIVEQAEGKGSTIVRVSSSNGYNLIALDLVNTSQSFAVLDVYRDAISEATLNSTTKVIITEDPTILTPGYTALPASSFTIDPVNPKVGNDYLLTFNPGEFYKPLKITIEDASLLNPNQKYALGFKITSVDNNGKVSADQQKVLVEIAFKNIWDGIYSVVSGFVQRYSAPGVPTTDALNGSLAGQADVTLSTVVLIQ